MTDQHYADLAFIQWVREASVDELRKCMELTVYMWQFVACKREIERREQRT